MCVIAKGLQIYYFQLMYYDIENQWRTLDYQHIIYAPTRSLVSILIVSLCC